MTPRGFKGVCGEERAASEPRVGCGARFDLGSAGLTVARWFDGVPGWRLLGCCPVCDRLVVDVPLRVPAACEVWRRAGARVAVFGRSAELDEAAWLDRCPPQSRLRAGQVARCAFSFVSVESLGFEAAEMAEEER